MFGIDAPTLRLLAIRVLSQTASASLGKQNWRTFSFIHKKARNSLAYTKLMKFAYCHYNMKLRSERMERLNQRKGEPEEDLLDKIRLLSDDDSVDEIEKTFSKWLRGARINLDAALIEMVETSHSYSGRHGNHESSTAGVNSCSSESDGGLIMRMEMEMRTMVLTMINVNCDEIQSTPDLPEKDCGVDHSAHFSKEKDFDESSKRNAYHYSCHPKKKLDPSAIKTQSSLHGKRRDSICHKCHTPRKRLKYAGNHYIEWNS